MVLTILILTLLGLTGAAAAAFYIRGLEPQDVWSIGVYEGAEPLDLCPSPLALGQPVLTASDVTDATARFVADPFIVRDGNQWWMFIEVLNKRSRRGEIAVASSRDGLAWTYDRVVLRETFHLSYPYVFEAEGGYCMIPESGQSGVVRLYRAVAFPYEWQFDRVLLPGRYVDASVLHFEGRWWLFAQRDGRALDLFFADHVDGPWVGHPANPIVLDDAAASRPGGRILQWDGRIIRYAQDGVFTYGRRVRAFHVEELTTTRYRERECAQSPVLDATGSGWNANGMHHVDAMQLATGRWIAAVDGKRIVQRFNWRRAVRPLFAR